MDPEYAEVVRDNRRKWRKAHLDYDQGARDRLLRKMLGARPRLSVRRTFPFQKELYAQMPGAQRSAAQQRLVRLLGPVAESYAPAMRC